MAKTLVLAILSATRLRTLKKIGVCIYKCMSGDHVKYARKISKLSPLRKQYEGCKLSYPFALKSKDINIISPKPYCTQNGQNFSFWPF